MRPEFTTCAYKQSIWVTKVKMNPIQMSGTDFEMFKAELQSVYEAEHDNCIVYDLTELQKSSFSFSQIIKLIKHLKSFQTVSTEKYNKCVIVLVNNLYIRTLAEKLVNFYCTKEQKFKTKFPAANIDICSVIDNFLSAVTRASIERT